MEAILMEKGWSDTTFPDSSPEAVERGETIGSFLFPGRSFASGTDKWDADRKASGCRREHLPAVAGLRSGCSCRKLHPLIPYLSGMFST